MKKDVYPCNCPCLKHGATVLNIDMFAQLLDSFLKSDPIRVLEL